MNHRS